MLRGEAVDSLMILLSGRLQAQIQGRGGKTLRIEVLKAPQAVAAGVLFLGRQQAAGQPLFA